nr:MAG TPA: hypothetical protein [Caudoviricetes sp.]
MLQHIISQKHGLTTKVFRITNTSGKVLNGLMIHRI